MKKILLFIALINSFVSYSQKRTVAPVYTTATQALTNKSIDADVNTLTNIDNAGIKANAGIAVNKLAALTGNRVMVTDGSGFNSASSITTTTLGYLDATSSVQTQFDAKFTKGGDTGGDLYLGANDAYNLIFKTDGQNRLWINSSGGVAIGTSASNDFKLQLYGTGGNGSGAAIAIGDVFNTSTPYVGIREKGGTDTDQLEAYGQKGGGIFTGTYGSTARIWANQAGAVMIGTETPVSGAELTVVGDQDLSGNLNIQGNGTVASFFKHKTSSTPTTPANGTEFNLYYKSNKLIIQYNDGGTVRYKYLDLTGIGTTWTHTTTAP